MSLFRILASVLFVLLTGSCTEHDNFPRNYARVSTSGVNYGSASSYVFRGRILSIDQPISQHGFVWGTFKALTINNGEHLSLGVSTSKGEFSSSVSINGPKDVRYYMRAYVQSNGFTVYGDAVSFWHD